MPLVFEGIKKENMLFVPGMINLGFSVSGVENPTCLDVALSSAGTENYPRSRYPCYRPSGLILLRNGDLFQSVFRKLLYLRDSKPVQRFRGQISREASGDASPILRGVVTGSLPSSCWGRRWAETQAQSERSGYGVVCPPLNISTRFSCLESSSPKMGHARATRTSGYIVTVATGTSMLFSRITAVLG